MIFFFLFRKVRTSVLVIFAVDLSFRMLASFACRVIEKCL